MRSKLSYILLSALWLALSCGIDVSAQVVTEPINQLPSLKPQSAVSKSFHKAKSGNNKSRQPGYDVAYGWFFDDFSRPTGTQPDTGMWEAVSASVFVNNTFAVEPISKGVATFDGFNSAGLPYDPTNPAAFGACDTLLSKPIPLNDVPIGKEGTVWLTFWWQPGGAHPTMEPDSADRLTLEFKNPQSNTWRVVWWTAGFPNREFRYQAVNVPLAYQNSGFQFRFTNSGSRTGAFDLFHLDYIRLNFDQNGTEKNFADLAFTGSINGLLKNYTSMPRHHIKLTDTLQSADSIEARLYSLNNLGRMMPDRIIVPFNTFAQVSEKGGNVLFNIQSTDINGAGSAFNFTDSIRVLKIRRNFFTSQGIPVPIAPLNNGEITFKYFIGSGGLSNEIADNDTVSITTPFYDYYSYDDGSPELLRYVAGNNAKGAVRFVTQKPDSLTHVYFNFPRTAANQAGLVTFSLYIMKFPGSAATNFKDSVLFRSTVPLSPATTPGALTEYILPRKIGVSDTFYIGWQQGINAENEVRIGTDINTKFKGNFIFSSGRGWQTYRQDDFSLIVRARFQQPDTALALSKPILNSANAITIQPNPASATFSLPEISDSETELSIINLQGQVVLQSLYNPETAVNIQSLQPGYYIVQTKSPALKIRQGKLIISK